MDNKTIFKVGQDVYCGLFKQWGKIIKINKSSSYPIEVRTKSELCYDYTNDGRYSDRMVKSLSFTEYKIEGVDQTPPRKPYEVGDVVYDHRFEGPGKVVRISSEGTYPVMVDFDGSWAYCYMLCGRFHTSHHLPTLSFTEYDLKNGGFT